MPLNIGLIGCGRAAERLYLPILSSLDQARLVAVADPIRERRELVSSYTPGCLAFSSTEELLQEARIAAAIITTPPTTHVPIAMQVLSAGIHVLVEKPLAHSMAGVEALEALVTSSRGPLMVGFNRRYWEPARQLRQIVCNLHDSSTVSAQLIIMTNPQAWSPISGVSDLLDNLGSHQLDLLRYIFDCEILAISARWTDTRAIRMRVRLSSGVVANCLTAYSNVYKESITVQCEHQQYHLHTGSDRIQPAAGPIRSLLDLPDMLRRRLRGQSSFRNSNKLELMSFLNCVRTGATPQPGIADGIAAVRAVEAARKSAASHGLEVLI